MSPAPTPQAASGPKVITARPSPTTTRQRGVLLINLGTPDRPDAASVRRYLREFLADPEVIRLPLRCMNLPLASLIALFRAGTSAELYRNIWTDRGSPLKVITADQADALERTLPKGWRVFYAMRYGAPSIASTLDEIVQEGITELVVIPMYPQFSGPTTGTALADMYEHLRDHGRQLSLTVRSVWHDDAGYVDAQAALIRDVAEARGLHPSDCVLLYSTHSMPESYIERGDPYQGHVLRTVDLVTRRLGWPEERTMVSYQSKLGPVPWLAPGTQETLADLARAGEKNVLVCPISFTADCLETLEELGITYRREFEAAGGRLHLCPSLNTYEPFIKTLASLVLRGPKPVQDGGTQRPPLIVSAPAATTEESSDIGKLVMVGVSLPPRLPDCPGPKLRHVTPEQFQQIKRPHEEVQQLLPDLRAAGNFRECWLWNTCRRFEFYGWLAADAKSAEADQAVARIVTRIIGPDAETVPHNVLWGLDAWHHVARTAAGLNGGLPGDAEITEQLCAAQRLARQCGTEGPRTQHLLDQVIDTDHELCTRAGWGRFRTAYCPIAIRCTSLDDGIAWDGARCVVIGGSVTARSTLLALRAQFGVPERLLTAVYRAHCRGRQIKRLRAAVGNGRRLRVTSYTDRTVLEAIADADLVFYGIDASTPVLNAEDLRGLRDFDARPLTIFDFNTFGSTTGADAVSGVRVHDARRLENEVTKFSHCLSACPAFSAARSEAETWLQRRLEAGPGKPVALAAAAAQWPAECLRSATAEANPSLRACPRPGGPPMCPRVLLAERTES